MRFISAIVLTLLVSFSTHAAIDSLIVKGRIINFSGRLYRQGPSITFSRNNIFQPQAELSKQVEIQADGSFRASLPLIFSQEEIYLDYSGKVFTTFLGAPGTVEITFNGDSLLTAKKLFYFAGVNAEANNQYSQYLTIENRLFKENTILGTDFYKTFWQKDAQAALVAADHRAALRNMALTELSSKNVSDPALNLWIKSLIDEEKLQNIFEYVLANDLKLGTMLDSTSRFTDPPLTSQRVTWMNRFGNYADRKIEEWNYQNPTKNRSLPVKTMATLVKTYVPNMTDDEREKIGMISENGVAERVELDFISKLYSRNETTLNLLFNFERALRTYSELFDTKAVDFLKARYLSKNFYKFTIKQIGILSPYIQTRISAPQFKNSLDELVKLELKDSVEINQVLSYKTLETLPKEVVPGYWFAASNDRGTTWLNAVLNKYSGKTIYLIKWSLDDEKSREELEYLPLLRAQLPDNVEFVYLQGTFTDELSDNKDLWKQYVIRHHLKGVHLSIDSNQAMDLLFKLNPLDAATFAIIKPNGKFYLKTAPAPSNTQKAAEAILQAAQ